MNHDDADIIERLTRLETLMEGVEAKMERVSMTLQSFIEYRANFRFGAKMIGWAIGILALVGSFISWVLSHVRIN